MSHKELIERLRVGENYRELTVLADEAADAIEALQAAATEYQQAAHNMAMEHKVERDALTQRVQELEEEEIKSQLYLEKATRKSDTLRQQLAEAQALIEASRKQEPVYAFRRKGLDDFCTCSGKRFLELSSKQNLFEVKKFYATPVVADDVLKAAQDILRKEALSNIKQKIRSALHFSIQVLENSKAVGGAND